VISARRESANQRATRGGDNAGRVASLASGTRSLTHTQNFLRSEQLVRQLVTASSIGPEDTVIDIGAGTGVITSVLAAMCARVIAVEADPKVFNDLENRFRDDARVELHRADFLGFDLPGEPYKVFSNIPFDRTAEIIRKLTHATRPPDDAYLVVQRAAALRFAGRPHADDSQVSILLKPFFDVEIGYEFARSDFRPAPNVDIVLQRLRRRDLPALPTQDAAAYRDFVVYSYTRWRPVLRKSVEAVLTHPQFLRLSRDLGFSYDATPTDLTVDQWVGLFRFVRDLPEGRQSKFRGAETRVQSREARTLQIHRTREAQGWRSARPNRLGP
jgi:23S rRNA (adenine-N6)-dimethyltransferase